MNTVSFLSIPGGHRPRPGGDRVRRARASPTPRRCARVRRLGRRRSRGSASGRGTRVAALHTNSHRYVEAYYATAMLGGVFIPLNYRAKRPELEHMLTAGAARGAARRRALPRARSRRCAPRCRRSRTRRRASTAPRRRAPGLRGAARRPRRSTRRRPRSTTTTRRSSCTRAARPRCRRASCSRFGDFTAYVTANVELADGTPRGAALLCVPLYHIAGATNMMTTLWTGRRLVLMPQFEPRAWLDLVERERITHAFVVPTMLKQLLDQPDLERRDLVEPRDPLVRRRADAVPGDPARDRALPAERRLRERLRADRDDVDAHRPRSRRPPARGHARRGRAAHAAAHVDRAAAARRRGADRRRRRARRSAPGEVGEIQVRTPRVMKGYAGAAARRSRADGWLPTRDMGWVDEDGYLFIAGRKDDMIIRGGENIAPAEVESVLQSHPAVEEAAVVGVPDVEWGQRVAAFVVLRPGASAHAGRSSASSAASGSRASRSPRSSASCRAAEEPDGQDPAPRAARAARGVVSRGRGPSRARRPPSRPPRPDRRPAVELAVRDGVAWITLARPATRQPPRRRAARRRSSRRATPVEDADDGARRRARGARAARSRAGLPRGCAWPPPRVAGRRRRGRRARRSRSSPRCRARRVGWGLALALACDLRVAASSAAVRRCPRSATGRLPGGGVMPRLGAHGRARRARSSWRSSARGSPAARAARVGARERGGRAGASGGGRRRGWRARLAARGPARAPSREGGGRAGLDLPLADGIRLEHDLYVLLQTTADRREGIRAFLERRTPALQRAIGGPRAWRTRSARSTSAPQCGAQVIVTKGGAGTIKCCGAEMQQKK